MKNDKRKKKTLDFPIIKCAKKEVRSCLNQLFLSRFPSYSPPTLERTGIKWGDAQGGGGGMNLGNCSQSSEPVLMTEGGFSG